MRMPNDTRLAESVDGIDIILGGHDHHYEVKKVFPQCNLFCTCTQTLRHTYIPMSCMKIISGLKSNTELFHFYCNSVGEPFSKA